VLKYLAIECEGARPALLELLARQSVRLAGQSPRAALEARRAVRAGVGRRLAPGSGRQSISMRSKSRTVGARNCARRHLSDAYLTGVDFAGEGVGEETTVRQLLERTVLNVLRPLRLMGRALVLLDALYGDGPVLDQLESYREAPAYVIGAQKLTRAQTTMRDLPESVWRDTGAQPRRGWAASGVAQAWLAMRAVESQTADGLSALEKRGRAVLELRGGAKPICALRCAHPNAHAPLAPGF